MITLPDLQKLFPQTPKSTLAPYVDMLNKWLPAYEITNSKRVASFMAQVGHESGGFVFRIENLNYSSDGLRKVFGKYFPTKALADGYARKPSMIASRVYANRMGNGSESSGDGWKYRGRGLIQVTGKNNYTALAKWLELTMDETIVFCDTIEGAVASAVWFWTANDLNPLADGDQITNISKRINGGTNGLAHRKQLWNAGLKIWAGR